MHNVLIMDIEFKTVLKIDIEFITVLKWSIKKVTRAWALGISVLLLSISIVPLPLSIEQQNTRETKKVS